MKVFNSEIRRLDEKIDRVEKTLSEKIESSSKTTIFEINKNINDTQKQNKMWFIGVVVTVVTPYLPNILKFLSDLLN